jgi:hypothetical protein
MCYHGNDLMVVEFTSNYAISAYHSESCEFSFPPNGQVYLIQPSVKMIPMIYNQCLLPHKLRVHFPPNNQVYMM